MYLDDVPDHTNSLFFCLPEPNVAAHSASPGVLNVNCVPHTVLPSELSYAHLLTWAELVAAAAAAASVASAAAATTPSEGDMVESSVEGTRGSLTYSEMLTSVRPCPDSALLADV